MITASVSKRLIEQITKEFYSAYLYLDFANYYNLAGLAGFGNWFTVQAQEERDHALLFSKYLLNNGIAPVLGAMKSPTAAYADYKAPLDAALAHERYITASIYDIYTEASTMKDYRTIQFLDWFVKEQGEEEKNADDLIRKFDLFGLESKSLYMLDAELAARIYAPPSLII